MDQNQTEQGYSEETILHASAAFGSLLWVGGILLPVALYYGLWESNTDLKPKLFKIVDFQITIFIISIFTSIFLYQGLSSSNFEDLETKLAIFQKLPSMLMLVAFLVPGVNAMRAHKGLSIFYPNLNPGLTKKIFATLNKSTKAQN